MYLLTLSLAKNLLLSSCSMIVVLFILQALLLHERYCVNYIILYYVTSNSSDWSISVDYIGAYSTLFSASGICCTAHAQYSISWLHHGNVWYFACRNPLVSGFHPRLLPWDKPQTCGLHGCIYHNFSCSNLFLLKLDFP